MYKVLNTLNDAIIFTGTLQQCKELIINDKTGFLELIP